MRRYGIPRNEFIPTSLSSRQLHPCRFMADKSRASAMSNIRGLFHPNAVAVIAPAMKKNVHPPATCSRSNRRRSNVFASRDHPFTAGAYSNRHSGGRSAPGAISTAPAPKGGQCAAVKVIAIHGRKFGTFAERALSSTSRSSASCLFWASMALCGASNASNRLASAIAACAWASRLLRLRTNAKLA